MSVVNILGYPVSLASAQACAREMDAWIDAGEGCRIVSCINPHSYASAKKLPEFAAALRAADWLLPDGIGVVIAGKLTGIDGLQRVTGSDIFAALCARLDARGGRKVFFLGSTKATLGRIQARMTADYPGIEIAGTLSPPFKDRFTPDEIRRQCELINASGADVLWVGMTAPKQEVWLEAARPYLKVRVAGAIGAVFDFYAGTISRPSRLTQALGLEWFARWVREPRRLWSRVFVSGPTFLFDVLWARRS
jgi:N-acetylglucosaminyldiphosphoundecaprenol N-acetyl-beta-D-mannosaminyltransferase